MGRSFGWKGFLWAAEGVWAPAVAVAAAHGGTEALAGGGRGRGLLDSVGLICATPTAKLNVPFNGQSPLCVCHLHF